MALRVFSGYPLSYLQLLVLAVLCRILDSLSIHDLNIADFFLENYIIL